MQHLILAPQFRRAEYSILSDMDFVYPYHQAVGFYLEASQLYSVPDIGVFENIPKAFDFCLDYNMEKTEYSRRWKLNYPIELID